MRPRSIQRRTQIRRMSLPQDALEHRVDVAELAVEIEALGQLLGIEQLLDLGILGEQRPEVAVLFPTPSSQFRCTTA